MPWNRLGKEPVVVLLDRIFILAEPLVEDHYDGDDDEEKKREAKRRRVEVRATLEQLFYLTVCEQRNSCLI